MANKHRLMIGYHMYTGSCERSNFEVTHVSSIPVDVMREDVVLQLQQKYPDLTTVTPAQSVSSKDIQYRTGMIIVHGSVGGLPEFVEILQMCILENTLIFICKKISIMVQRVLQSF